MKTRIRILEQGLGANFKTIDSNEAGKFQNFMDIDPDIARSLLGKGRNRSLKSSKVEQYARDMKNGEWRIGDSQICLSADGTLMNGQHRLHAIIVSGTTQMFSFLYGVTDEDMQKIDTGTTRTLHDVTSINGIDADPFAVKLATYLRRQTIQNMPRRATRAEEVEFLNEHLPSLKLVSSIFRGPDHNKRRPVAGFVIGNDIASVFVRAILFYINDKIKLNRVMEFAYALANNEDYILLMSMNTPENSAFPSLVKLLIAEKGLQGQKSRDIRYQKTENALKKFVEKTPVELLIASKKELFMLSYELHRWPACVKFSLSEKPKNSTCIPPMAVIG